MRTLASVAAALGLWACSNDQRPAPCSADTQCGPGRVCDTGTCKTASVRTVGEACTTDAACSVGSVCATAMPGGLCTFTCAGDACPSGATCTDLRASGSGILCSKSCTTSSDCRSGYSCCPGFGACVPDASCPPQGRPASSDLGNACTGSTCAAGEICGSGPEFPGGACTAACNPADQGTCPSGSSCVSTSTGSFCFASCSAQPPPCANTQLTCTGGLCRAPNAPPVCKPTGTAPAPVQGGVSGPQTDPGCVAAHPTPPLACVLPTTAKGTQTVGAQVSVTVPPGTGSMTIYSQGVNVPVTQVFLNNGSFAIPNSVVPTLIRDPSDAQLFDDLPAPPADASGLPIFYASFSPFTGTMTLPNTSLLLEHTSLQGGIAPGVWKFTVNDFAQECTQVSRCSGGGTSDTYDIQVNFKPGIAPATGTVDFAFYFVGGPVSYAQAPASAAFTRMLSSLAQIYATAGICLGKVTLYDMPMWVKNSTEFSVINADDQSPCGPLSRLFTLSAPGNQINIFLVNGFKNAAGSSINVVGVDGTIPGPSGIGGTVSSGASANGSDLVAGLGCGTGFSPRTCGPDSVAYIVAHEAGHFMGLYHTTERTGDSFDPLSDSKKCECTACAPTPSAKSSCASNNPPGTPTDMLDSYCVSPASVPQCGGGENLMFWLFGDNSTAALSPQQGQVMRANPVVR